LRKEGFPDDEHVFARTADLRYFGQAFEVRVALADGAIGQAELDAAATGFHDAHRALYGYDFRGDPAQQVEWVNLRVSGIGPIRRPEIRRHDPGDPEPVVAAPRRPVCFDPAEGYLSTPVVQRSALAVGTLLRGPAVVEEYGATVPLHPGFAARVDPWLNLVVTREEQA
jgi:N-methylhydantoinase A